MRAGVLNVSKPAGATSFSVVRRLRDLTHARRVGHAGTLDPLATGVLPILFESATRLSDYAHRLPKTYEARVHLGFRTSTDDAEAELLPVASPASIDAAAVAEALAGFVGRISQEPPAFSAVKVEGRRAYERARAGEPGRPAAREVEVYSAELLEFDPGEQASALIRVVCGRGVYMRSLGRDLGERLGVGGGRHWGSGRGRSTVRFGWRTPACSRSCLTRPRSRPGCCLPRCSCRPWSG